MQQDMSSVTWCLVGTGTGEDRLQLWQPSLRSTWARLHWRQKLHASSFEQHFFFCFLNNRRFCTVDFEAFICFHAAVLAEACSFSPSNYLNPGRSSLSFVKRRQLGQRFKSIFLFQDHIWLVEEGSEILLLCEFEQKHKKNTYTNQANCYYVGPFKSNPGTSSTWLVHF